jgi:hypothetical protein
VRELAGHSEQVRPLTPDATSSLHQFNGGLPPKPGTSRTLVAAAVDPRDERRRWATEGLHCGPCHPRNGNVADARPIVILRHRLTFLAGRPERSDGRNRAAAPSRGGVAFFLRRLIPLFLAVLDVDHPLLPAGALDDMWWDIDLLDDFAQLAPVSGSGIRAIGQGEMECAAARRALPMSFDRASRPEDPGRWRPPWRRHAPGLRCCWES